MKRILTAIALTAAMIGTAQAQHHGGRYPGGWGHHHHYRQWHPHYGWVVPAIVGGAVVYAITRPAQAEPAPVVVAPPAPTGQVILQNAGVACPEGTAPFFNQRIDRYGRPFYEFDTCK